MATSRGDWLAGRHFCNQWLCVSECQVLGINGDGGGATHERQVYEWLNRISMFRGIVSLNTSC